MGILIFLLDAISIEAQRQKQPSPRLMDSAFVFVNSSFESCHASTLCELSGNRIMVAWFGGKYEGSTDVAIWSSIKKNNSWSKLRKLADGQQNDSVLFPSWNPVLFKSRNDLLFLFYKVGRSPREWWAEMKVSRDDGETWSSPKKLPSGFLGPIKNKPIQFAGGDIFYPSSTETAEGDKWTIHQERSDSTGNNWRYIPIDCDEFGVIQPTILTYRDGRMQLLCRSRQNAIVQTWSYDSGFTWRPLRALSLPNPNSGIDAVSLRDGRQLLIYNPLRTGRSKLTMAISSDGLNWKDVYVLEDHSQGEYSYPSVIQSNDGSIHISYTYNRKKIKYARFNL